MAVSVYSWMPMCLLKVAPCFNMSQSVVSNQSWGAEVPSSGHTFGLILIYKFQFAGKWMFLRHTIIGIIWLIQLAISVKACGNELVLSLVVELCSASQREMVEGVVVRVTSPQFLFTLDMQKSWMQNAGQFGTNVLFFIFFNRKGFFLAGCFYQIAATFRNMLWCFNV